MAFLPFSTSAKEWEPIALNLGRLAGLRDGDALNPEILAGRVGLCLVRAEDALADFEQSDRDHLLVTASSKWSGGVFPQPLPDGKFICILNPTHHPRRNRITLMEEIVHVFRRHGPTGLRTVLPGLRVRDYDKKQEMEAYGVGAAALLPWTSFYHALDAGIDIGQMAEDYDVTTELIKYRIKITGATNLYRSRCMHRKP